MSYAQGTLHFNLPITTGSDKRSWFDTNEAFIDIDAALWNATQSVTAAATAVEALTTQVGALSESVQTLTDAYTALSGNVNTISEVVQGHTFNIQQLQTATANKVDSVAIADAYNPNLTYSVDAVVMYNGQRYRCITAVTSGEPFDQSKWSGEDVETVLEDLKSDLPEIVDSSFTNTGSAITAGSHSHVTLSHTIPAGKTCVGASVVSGIGGLNVYEVLVGLPYDNGQHITLHTNVNIADGQGLNLKMLYV